MHINELVRNVELVHIIPGSNSCGDLDIAHMTYATSDIQKGSLFFCIEGTRLDGHKLAAQAAALGAAAVVVSKPIGTLSGCMIIAVRDTREAMALMAANFFHKPSKNMDLIGFTGTNGKTTSTYMLRSILENNGIRTGIMGTICNSSGVRTEPSVRTTMESLDLHRELSTMADDGDRAVVMEVSSHSLALKRVYGLYFKVGVFTNLTQDHLDFHGTMENYFEAKAELFRNTGWSVLNYDDPYGRQMAGIASGKVLRYGMEDRAACDVFADRIQMDENGSCFELCVNGTCMPVKVKLPGRFNVYNALGAAAAAAIMGVEAEKIRVGLELLESVPGRSERIQSKKGFSIVIDYAHTPDGIMQILATAREYTRGRLIILFGCGGDRDKIKRPIMGKVAGEHADLCIVTSDNPRSEEPMAIIRDILPGVLQTGCPYESIPDRREAIARALELAADGDVVIIAGKGHETYQILKDRTIHFDEREIIRELLKEDETLR